MNAVNYFLQVNIYLIMLYAFFQVLLRKETFHQSNRWYLLSAILMSFLIPMTQLDSLKNLFFTEQVVSIKKQIQVFEFQYITLPTVVESFTWKDAIVWSYWIGTLVFLGLFCVKIWKLVRLLKYKENGIAFSFFNKRYVQPHLENASVIAYHEYIHSKQGHSFDMMLLEFVKILFWFNPIIWCYQKSLRNLHEFIADEESARFQGDTAAYAMLIVSNTLGVKQAELSNHFFNSSILKQRITMLHKNKSPKIAALKFGIVLPVFAAMLIFSSSKIEASEPIKNTINELNFNKPIDVVKEKISNVSQKVEEISTKSALNLKDTTRVLDYNEADEPANFPGGYVEFGKFMAKNLKTPTEAIEKRVNGKTLIGFTIDEKGQLDDFKVIKSLIPACDKEAIRVLKLSPKWSPATHKGEKRKMRFQIPIAFSSNTYSDNEKLEGKVLGVNFNNKSNINSPMEIDTDTLFVINGGISSNEQKDQLNPNDIESISVIKGKSAIALHGNGAVIITTKTEQTDAGKRISLKDSKDVEYFIDGVKTDMNAVNQTPREQIKEMAVFKSEKTTKDSNKNKKETSQQNLIIITTKNAGEEVKAKNNRIITEHGFSLTNAVLKMKAKN